MIVCPKCSKENQDHYKFCLGCGNDLPRPEKSEKPLSKATPPAGVAAAASAPAPAPASEQSQAVENTATEPPPGPIVETAPEPAPEPEPEPAPEPEPKPKKEGPEVCVNCGADIPDGFAFCGACGTPVSSPDAVEQPAAGVQSESAVSSGASIILIQPDGSEGGSVDIPDSEVLVGRDAGGFFETDAYLSPKHAVFKASGSQVIVRDESSLNGVFKKMIPNELIEIKAGNIFRMGQELLLFETIDEGSDGSDGTKRMGSPIEGLWGRVSLIIGKDRLGNSFPVGDEGIICGRERGNILFPDDGYISGVHLRLHTEDSKFYITDLGSSNGTYVKLTAETALNNDDFILMGAQLFRIKA